MSFDLEFGTDLSFWNFFKALFNGNRKIRKYIYKALTAETIVSKT